MSSDHSFSVMIDRVACHFCASHALVLADYVEGLHGHNYRVEVEVTGNLTPEGILIDFIFLEGLLQQLVTDWDHYVLLPSDNPRVQIQTVSGESNLQIHYKDRIYSIPEVEVKILPCINVTAETLARLLGEKLVETLQNHKSWEQVQAITVHVWETRYYKASYTFTQNDPSLPRTS